MSPELDALKGKFEGLKTVIASAEALLAGLAQRIRDTAGDRQAALDLAADVDASKGELAAAVEANTVP